jgi:hypothetical protein
MPANTLSEFEDLQPGDEVTLTARIAYPSIKNDPTVCGEWLNVTIGAKGFFHRLWVHRSIIPSRKAAS